MNKLHKISTYMIWVWIVIGLLNLIIEFTIYPSWTDRPWVNIRYAYYFSMGLGFAGAVITYFIKKIEK